MDISIRPYLRDMVEFLCAKQCYDEPFREKTAILRESQYPLVVGTTA